MIKTTQHKFFILILYIFYFEIILFARTKLSGDNSHLKFHAPFMYSHLNSIHAY